MGEDPGGGAGKGGAGGAGSAGSAGAPGSPAGGVKGRLKIPRQPLPMRDPAERRSSWDEAAIGFAAEMARVEADRCILCRRPPCVDGCPIGIDIPEMLRAVQQGDIEGSFRVLTDSNTLPAVCGRVCPQDQQCEKVCVITRKGESVAIGTLERFIADWAREAGVDGARTAEPNTGRRVSVVGSGPAGIAAAGDLARLGHEVTIYEALHVPGGVMIYGIPEFRLPNEVVAYELSMLDKLGVRIVTNAVIGRTLSVDELLGNSDAVFLATGAGLPTFLSVPGESLNGIYSGNEFLMRVNMMRADRFPECDTPVKIGKRVVVVGGGDTSMDCCRVALRLGAESVTLLYRRSRDLMPARSEEIDHALEEGVELRAFTTPVRFIAGEGDRSGWVTGVECVELELGEPDESGRARPVPKAGSEYRLECDSAVIAIGFGVNPTVTRAEPRISTDQRGVVLTDEGGATSLPGVFAGGDLITGGSTVVSAVGQGRKAARAIHEYLAEKDSAVAAQRS